MTILNRAQILAPRQMATETVSVPEWGGDVVVRELTGAERDQWEGSFIRIEDGKREVNYENIRARLVALSVVDESGDRIFDLDDVGVLGQQPAAALDRVFMVARRLSHMTDEDIQKLAKS